MDGGTCYEADRAGQYREAKVWGPLFLFHFRAAFPIGIIGVMSQVTVLLAAIERGDRQAAAQLLPLVYDKLRALAAQKMAHEKPGQTLDATALVHEAYLRLVGEGGGAAWDNRGHFFAAAAEAMRRILVDRARARRAEKRGGGRERVPAELDSLAARYSDAELIDTDSVVDSLSRTDAEAADLVRLHVFGGLTVEEAGAALGMSRATAYRNWSFARAWLRAALSGSS
jgi:RNA polymerase sigma factor (TIGR02999 family)